MLHRIPEGVPDKAASLHEPVSIALHGLAHHPPQEATPILIVGAASSASLLSWSFGPTFRATR